MDAFFVCFRPIPSHLFNFILSFSFSDPRFFRSSLYFMWLERVGMGVMGIVGKKNFPDPR